MQETPRIRSQKLFETKIFIVDPEFITDPSNKDDQQVADVLGLLYVSERVVQDYDEMVRRDSQA